MGQPEQMSDDARAKGEAFVEALIAEGHRYRSMKAAFGECALRIYLRLTGGVVSDAAKKMGMAPRIIFLRLKQFGMREELEAIRQAKNGAWKGTGQQSANSQGKSA